MGGLPFRRWRRKAGRIVDRKLWQRRASQIKLYRFIGKTRCMLDWNHPIPMP